MSQGWERLFAQEEHVLREPEVAVIELVRVLRRAGARRVLDWGCGAGRHVVYLARQGFEVTGLDPAPTAIRRAHQWVQEEGLKAVLSTAQPGRVPAEDGEYDAVLSAFAVEHGTREEVERSVRELVRVLRPGGYLLVALSSQEDSLSQTGSPAPGGVRIPRSGPEEGVSHYLSSRGDLEEFFRGVEVVQLAHVCRRVRGAGDGQEARSAHWWVLGRKEGGW